MKITQCKIKIYLFGTKNIFNCILKEIEKRIDLVKFLKSRMD